jgi:hypothetical protein
MVAVISLAAVCAALVLALTLIVRGFVAHVRELEDGMSLERIAWVEERRELLNRIQRPEYVPTAPAVRFEIPEPEPDDFEQVGTIRLLDEEIV